MAARLSSCGTLGPHCVVGDCGGLSRLAALESLRWLGRLTTVAGEHPIEIEFQTTEQHLRDLCREYWEFDDAGRFAHTVKLLSERYHVPQQRVAETVRSLSTAYCRDELCSRECGRVQPYSSRSDYEQRRRYRPANPFVCSECQLADRRQQQEEQEQRRRALVQILERELATASAGYVSFEHRSFREAVLFVSLVRAGASEDLASIRPLEGLEPPYTPNPEFDKACVLELYRNEIVRIHPQSPESSVFADVNGYRFYAPRVFWAISTPVDLSRRQVVENVEQLLSDAEQWPEDWLWEQREMHHEIALQECLQYLRVAMDVHGFDQQAIGDKTKSVLQSVLKHFSIAQAYNFIWSAAKNAAAFMVREGVPKPHAANTIPGSIQRRLERTLVEKWEVSPFRRDFRAPQSHLAHVLFTVALHLPDGGFTSIPPGGD